jgi:peptidoglycan/LPS O-acetylase OafA/YrhL
MARPPAFNANIHGCRGLFAFLVFIFHMENAELTSRYFWNTEFVLWFLPSFAAGVELFFCISGYVILMSMMKTPSPVEFMADRLFRVVPVLLVLQILLVVGGSIVRDKQFVNDMTFWQFSWLFVANALMLPGIFQIPQINPPAWSLSYEMLFYIVACMFYYWVCAVVTRRAAILALIAVVAVPLFVLYPRSVFFSVGILALLFEDRLRALAGRWWFTPLPYLVLFLLAWRVTWTTMAFRHNATALMDWMTAPAAQVVAGVVAYLAGTMFFFSVLHDPGWFGRLLRSRVAQYLGTISYSFYLWQASTEYVGKRLLTHFVLPTVGDEWGTTLLLLICLPVSLIASHLSYRVIEQDWTRRMRHSWKQHRLVLESAS